MLSTRRVFRAVFVLLLGTLVIGIDLSYSQTQSSLASVTELTVDAPVATPAVQPAPAADTSIWPELELTPLLFFMLDAAETLADPIEWLEANAELSVVRAFAHDDIKGGLEAFIWVRDLGLATPDLYTSMVTSLVAAESYATARAVGFEGIRAYPSHAPLEHAYDLSIDEDPDLFPLSVRVIDASVTTHALKALGGGSTVTLKFVDGDSNLGAVKPDQDLKQSRYRSEIAYFRLCIVLRCSFEVPHNEEVMIHEDDFLTLYDRVESAKQSNYEQKLDHMTWNTDEDGRRFVLATLKAWMPDMTRFPIEGTEAWSDWLSPHTKDEVYDAPLQHWLPEMVEAVGARGEEPARRIPDLAPELTVGDMAAQVSDLLLIDFLTNNWDRFAGTPDYYGANCHFGARGIIALDNGAAFPPWHTDRVVRRFKLSRRFSGDLVFLLRRMAYEETLERLFPDATQEEVDRFDLFWERRSEALATIDDLIARYGEDEVLYF